MPTYQYRCTDCGSDLEVVQKFSDAALTECPTCGGSLRKVFNAVGVVFKGSGFYRTDSRTPSKGESGGDAKGGSSGDGKTADGKGTSEKGNGKTTEPAVKKSGDKATGSSGSGGGKQPATSGSSGGSSTAS
jgi:putative FmdB family regulatory protein